ncbi:PQQ-binding-like beta-propeller repeat protein [Abditibacterium utsteinense]|nr:PQQ-binding-like beta-propeller repeat protein [Abditibacterium utsteinense]
MTSASSRRAQAAERNVRLDPQGIYGTRSARRQNQLRRRRQLQNLVLWLVGAVALGLLIWWLFQPRQSARNASWTRQLPFRPATPPFRARGNSLFFTSQSGGLWRWNPTASPASDWTSAAPRRFFSTAFAPAAPPLVRENELFWPGGDGILRALDARSGVQKWRGVLSSALVCTPAVVQSAGREIVAAGDDAGQVAAFDALTGAPLWKTDLGGAPGAALGVALGVASPQLSTKNEAGPSFLVPLLAGAASRGGLVCLDARSGRVKWSFPNDARSQSAGVAAPLTLGNRVFWCNDEGAAVCLDARSGRKIWKSFAAPQGANLQSQKSPNEESAESNASALVSLRGGAALIEAAGVVAFGGNDGFLRGFDIASGALRWKQNLGGAVRFPAQTLRFENQNVFLAAGDAPAIFLLDALTGRVVRRWKTPYAISYGLSVANESIYALDEEGHLQVAALK